MLKPYLQHAYHMLHSKGMLLTAGTQLAACHYDSLGISYLQNDEVVPTNKQS